MNEPDDGNSSEDSVDERFEALGRQAGRAVRRDAPERGFEELAGRARRQRVTKVGLAGGAAVVAVLIAVIAMTSDGDDSKPTVVATTGPDVATTVVTTTSSSIATTPSSSAPAGNETTVVSEATSTLVIGPDRSIRAPFDGGQSRARFAFVADGSQVIGDVGADDLAVIDLETGAELRRFGTPMSSLANFPFAVSPDGGRVTNGDGLWNPQTGERLASLSDSGSVPQYALFSPAGTFVAVVFHCELEPRGKCLRVFDARRGEKVFETSVGWSFENIRFSTDDTFLAFGAIDTGFDPNNPQPSPPVTDWLVVDLSTGVARPGAELGQLQPAVISPDGSLGLSVSGQTDDPLLNGIVVVDLRSSAAISELRLPANVGVRAGEDPAEFSLDGELVAAPLYDSGMNFVGVGLWRVTTGQLVATLGDLREPLSSNQSDFAQTEVHFSPDGQRLVTRDADGTMRIWSLPDTW